MPTAAQPLIDTLSEDMPDLLTNIAAVFAWLEEAGFCVEGQYQHDLLATA
jgi:hypothetical protein